jgi:hypothetical protein
MGLNDHTKVLLIKQEGRMWSGIMGELFHNPFIISTAMPTANTYRDFHPNL